MSVQAELTRVTAERDAVQRVVLEAMAIMTDVQIAELRQRMDGLDQGTRG